jgi:hypothetical protein
MIRHDNHSRGILPKQDNVASMLVIYGKADFTQCANEFSAGNYG